MQISLTPLTPKPMLDPGLRLHHPRRCKCPARPARALVLHGGQPVVAVVIAPVDSAGAMLVTPLGNGRVCSASGRADKIGEIWRRQRRPINAGSACRREGSGGKGFGWASEAVGLLEGVDGDARGWERGGEGYWDAA